MCLILNISKQECPTLSPWAMPGLWCVTLPLELPMGLKLGWHGRGGSINCQFPADKFLHLWGWIVWTCTPHWASEARSWRRAPSQCTGPSKATWGLILSHWLAPCYSSGRFQKYSLFQYSFGKNKEPQKYKIFWSEILKVTTSLKCISFWNHLF